MKALIEALRLAEQGEPGVLVVVTAVAGHTPQVVGAKMVVRRDGTVVGTIGGGRVEQEVIDQALGCLTEGHPRTVAYKLKAELGMCCGGSMDLYMEPIAATDRLVLFGAGHVARPVAAFAHATGFHVVVVDDRSEWNSAERFPQAERHVEPHGDFLARERLRPTDYVVITTPNHDFDREILAATAPSAAGYVGMIGSTRKVEKALRMLRAEGVPDGALARAFAPIGLDICAETPEEIAISIVGELIRHRRQPTSRKSTRGAQVDSRTRAAATLDALTEAAEGGPA